uniref:Uncharacterized protein n=1 Tax=Oncorhynchus tshawytscha TaxID=74940 RepID=A0AAZ3NY87_ONCTS
MDHTSAGLSEKGRWGSVGGVLVNLEEKVGVGHSWRALHWAMRGHHRSEVVTTDYVSVLGYIEGLRQSVRHTGVIFSLRQKTVNMKLSIAIAVLMLVFAAHTEAQETEKTIEEHFTTFSNQMKDLSEDLTVKTKDIVEKIGDSEFITKTRYTHTHTPKHNPTLN